MIPQFGIQKMTFALDHVVIAVADLDRAVADYQSLGFTVYPGGVHHGGVSHNALVVFADGSYFEIIAYREAASANRWWRVLTTAGEGIVDFAILPENTEKELDGARGRGLSLEDPTPGGRLRPDGARLDWQIVRPATTDLPFWCGDITPRELRVPEGAIRRHANGVTGVSRVRVLVADVTASTERYRALVGPEAVSADTGVPLVGLKKTVLELVGPDNDHARRHLAARGEGVFSLKLRGSAAKVLDTKLLHGADLAIVA
jgi:catechol 2,3-dioxygenase-like lactoylglutathione lyase family enzyme